MRPAPEIKGRADLLRRMAQRQGRKLVKSHTRDPRSLEYGKYFLLGEGETPPPYTGRPREGLLTLDEAEQQIWYPLEHTKKGRAFTFHQLREWGVQHENLGSWSTATHRWYEERMCVFRAPDDGEVYGVELAFGLTEAQDPEPFLYLSDPAWCPRMEQRPVTELKWVPVE
jgi:hypothetical protein